MIGEGLPNPLKENGTDRHDGPLQLDVTDVRGGGTMDPLSNNSNHDVIPEEGGLQNPNRRDPPNFGVRGVNVECDIVRRVCKTHDMEAIMCKRKKRMWTKSSRTGLFGWRTTTSVQWTCPKTNCPQEPETDTDRIFSQIVGENLINNGIEHKAMIPGSDTEGIS